MRLDLPNESLSMINKAIHIDNNDPTSYKYKGDFLNYNKRKGSYYAWLI